MTAIKTGNTRNRRLLNQRNDRGRFFPNKALIYATNRCGLLIFQEPDFPDVPPHVPGGTIAKGEAPMAAAKREFAEETGMSPPTDMTFLDLEEYAFERNGRPHQVNRYSYHATVSDDLPETWDNYETFAHDGADPILFRFSWVDLGNAPDILGIGMEAAIPTLKERRGAKK